MNKSDREKKHLEWLGLFNICAIFISTIISSINEHHSVVLTAIAFFLPTVAIVLDVLYLIRQIRLKKKSEAEKAQDE